MATRTASTAPPTAPDLSAPGRYGLILVIVLACARLAWQGFDAFAAASGFPYPPPTPPAWSALIWPAVAVTVLVTAVSAARAVRYRRALEDHRVFSELARVAKMKDTDARAMSVNARRGNTPVDVTVRADAPTSARVRASAEKVAAAFAHAVGDEPEKVVIDQSRRGFRIRVHEDSLVRRHEANVRALAEEVEEAPVPAVAPRARTKGRIEQAIIGAVESDAITVSITDTNPDGSPLEVWVEYPARITAKMGDRLQGIRDTLMRVSPPSNDEWTIQWEAHLDRITLRDEKDPLAPTVPLPPIENRVDLFKGPIIGRTADGSECRLALMGGYPTLVAGATGAGKGSVLWNVIRGLSPMIADGTVRLWVIDPKGGQELGALEGIAHRFAVEDDEVLDMLTEARTEMKAKAARLRAAGIRKVEMKHISREFPLDLVIIDELADIIDNRSIGRDVETLTSSLARVGRSVAFGLLSATQNPRVKSVPNRSSYTQAIALRLNEPQETNMVLPGARATGALADLIPMAHPGIGYMVANDKAGFVRFRAAFVDEPDIEAVAASIVAAQRPAPELGAPIPAAEQPPLDEPAPAPRKATRAPAPKKPSGKGRALTVEQLADVVRDSDDPVTILLADSDTDAAHVTDVAPSPDREDDWRITYRHDGDKVDRECDMEAGERVTLLT